MLGFEDAGPDPQGRGQRARPKGRARKAGPKGRLL